jgi:hypothetical protein
MSICCCRTYCRALKTIERQAGDDDEDEDEDDDADDDGDGDDGDDENCGEAENTDDEGCFEKELTSMLMEAAARLALLPSIRSSPLRMSYKTKGKMTVAKA